MFIKPGLIVSATSLCKRGIAMKRILIVTVLVLLSLTLAAVARSRKINATMQQDMAAAQPTPEANLDAYVNRVQLWPQLREPLNALGDRLERPGKERVIFLGAVSRGQGNNARPFKLIQEFPGRLRTEEQNGNQTVVLGVDVSKGGPWKSGGVLTEDDEDEIESLASIQ
jgi:hypothetical protein